MKSEGFDKLPQRMLEICKKHLVGRTLEFLAYPEGDGPKEEFQAKIKDMALDNRWGPNVLSIMITPDDEKFALWMDHAYGSNQMLYFFQPNRGKALEHLSAKMMCDTPSIESTSMDELFLNVIYPEWRAAFAAIEEEVGAKEILPPLFYELFAQSLGLPTPKTLDEKEVFWRKYHEGDWYQPDHLTQVQVVEYCEADWNRSELLNMDPADPARLDLIREKHKEWLQK